MNFKWKPKGKYMKDFTSLYKELEYEYSNPDLLKHALTHSSYVNDNGMKRSDSNERLEFLGDAILGSIVGKILYLKYPETNEGTLTRLRAKIVCEKSLSDAARKLNLGDYLYLSKGEITDHGQDKPSILCDAMEAIIGSMYLDGGLEVTKRFVNRVLESVIKAAEDASFMEDSKSRLQRLLQRNGSVTIEYRVSDELGLPHDKVFVIDVYCNGDKLGTGCGKNKKEAEMESAHNAIESLKQKGDISVL
jgi:ribonuclease-3